MPVTALIANISRSSLHDGPGVRTVVYFKGCYMRCRWCHNPEMLVDEPEILYAPVKCIHCGRCVEICPSHHMINGDQMSFIREGCKLCGQCTEKCPSGALSLVGKRMTVNEVMVELRKDQLYYEQSGGGVTLSGGECLRQGVFCAELLRECNKEGIHTAVESALFVPWETIQSVLPFVDLFFADAKIADTKKHRQYTGQDNRLIFENLHKLAIAAPGRVIVRTPIIPGVNDAISDITELAEVLRPFADSLLGIELLRYNSLGKTKYQLIGKKYTDFGVSQDYETMERLCRALANELEKKTAVYTSNI